MPLYGPFRQWHSGSSVRSRHRRPWVECDAVEAASGRDYGGRRFEPIRRCMNNRLFTSVAFAALLIASRAEAQFAPAPEVAPAEDFNVELGLMFWQPTPELSLTTGDDRVGTEIGRAHV